MSVFIFEKIFDFTNNYWYQKELTYTLEIDTAFNVMGPKI